MARCKRRCEQLESRTPLALDPLQIHGVAFESSLSFQPVADGEQILASTLVDMDGDNDLDLVFSRTQSKLVSVAFSLGDGTFAAPRHIALADVPQIFASGDLNNDGAIDLVVSGESQILSLVSQQNEDGEWQGFSQSQAMTSAATSLELGDLDRDGLLDLVVGRSGRVDVRRGTGDGHFAAPVRYTSVPGSRVATLGDLDGDHDLDLVIGIEAAEPSGAQIVVLQNNGDGIFETQLDTFSPGDPAATLRMIDLDANGIDDLVIGHAAQENGNLSVWPGQGDGTLSRVPRRFEILGRPRQIAFALVDDDGLLDIVVGHSGTFHHPINDNGPGGISVLLGKTDTSFHPAIRISTPDGEAVSVTDFDEDGHVDILGVSFNTATWFRSTGKRFLNTMAHEYRNSLPFGTNRTVAADFDDDGYLDIINAWRGYDLEQPGSLSVQLGAADGSLTAGPQLTISGTPVQLFTGNFDSDVGTELLLVETFDFQSYRVIMLESNHNNSFSVPVVTQLPQAWTFHDTPLDVNADQRLDLLGYDPSGTGVRTWLASPDGHFQIGPVISGSANWQIQGVTDFNADLVADLMISDFQSYFVLLGNGDGTFREAFRADRASASLHLGDFDHDGNRDLAATTYDSPVIHIAFGDGAGQFPRAMSIDTFISLFELHVHDVNGDGRSDLIAVGYQRLSFALSTTSGFTPFVSHRLPHLVGQIMALDVDHDGLTELIAVPGNSFGISQAQVSIWPGTAQGSFADPITTTYAAFLSSYPASELLLLPIGHDGRIDLVLGTTNGFLKLRFNSAVPAAGDFDGDGRRSIADVDLLCQQLQLGLADNRFDLNADSHVSLDDMDYLLTELLQTVIGDVNLDGIFNSSDLVSLFQIGKYEDHVPRNTVWSEGDFNCDGDFTTADLVLAFQKARYSGI